MDMVNEYPRVTSMSILFTRVTSLLAC